MNYHEALYTLYHSVCQTKMSTNVHYIPIHQTYCLPNVLCVWYTHFSLSASWYIYPLPCISMSPSVV